MGGGVEVTPAHKAQARLGAKRRALLKAARKARAPARRAAQAKADEAQARFRALLECPPVRYRVVWTTAPR